MFGKWMPIKWMRAKLVYVLLMEARIDTVIHIIIKY